MSRQSTAALAGQDCLRLENRFLTLWAATAAGPRILGLAPAGGENLFAELPDEVIERPEGAPFRFYGGHRLWHAPEDPRRTYLPDDEPPLVEPLSDGLRLVQAVEPGSGLQKSLTIRLDPRAPEVEVEHTLTNRGLWPVETAPWAITQLKTGGRAFLPLSAPQADPYGVLPNRNLVFWPYADLRTPGLSIGRSLLSLRAALPGGAFKVGASNFCGWLAYLLGETLFVKQAGYQPGAAYYDLGSSSEIYCNTKFLELETLGPGVYLEPGESTSHSETWRLHSGVTLPDDEDAVLEVLAALGLEVEV